MARRCDFCGRTTAHIVEGFGGTSCVPCQVEAGGYVPPDVADAYRADFRARARATADRLAERYEDRRPAD